MNLFLLIYRINLIMTGKIFERKIISLVTLVDWKESIFIACLNGNDSLIIKFLSIKHLFKIL